MPIEETEHIGPYRLLGKLGQGGMGVVYRGVDDAGREVAVKVIRPELADDHAFRRRLRREVETMQRIRSPYVAQIIDADLHGERPYIVTQYVAGHPLDDTVRATGPLSGKLLVQVAAGLADALKAIHAAGVVHRDLKPNNVMLVSGEPVVIDFGIAHAADATRLTQTGMIIGTPGYLAPEVIDGAAPGPAIDIYAWGATVAFAATGRSPFGTGSMEAVLARVIRGQPDLAGVPLDLGGGVQVALSREPVRRPTAEQLSGWLRQLASPAPTPVPQTRALTPAPMMMVGSATPLPLPVTPVPMVTPLPLGAGRVDLGWYKLMAYLMVAAAVCLVVELPAVAGTLVVATVWFLRAGDLAVRSRRVPVRGVQDLLIAPLRLPGSMAGSFVRTGFSLLYAGVVASLVMSGLEALTNPPDDVTVASAAVGAWAYVILAGPLMMGPRRQLVRVLSAAARDRRTVMITGLSAAGIALVLLGLMWADQPRWAPITTSYDQLGSLHDQLRKLIDNSRGQ
jgi:serine/threonine protein kinase